MDVIFAKAKLLSFFSVEGLLIVAGPWRDKSSEANCFCRSYDGCLELE
jgi:hypothetical protein